MSGQGFHHSVYRDSEPDPRVRYAGMALTAHEAAVLKAVCREGGNSAAAESLGISEQTVKNHLSKIYAKLGVYSIGQAVYRLWLGPLFGDENADRIAALVPPSSVCEHPAEVWTDESAQGWRCGTCGAHIARRAAQWPRRAAA